MGIVTLDLRKTIAVILLTSSDVGWVIHSVFDIGKIISGFANVVIPVFVFFVIF